MRMDVYITRSTKYLHVFSSAQFILIPEDCWLMKDFHQYFRSIPNHHLAQVKFHNFIGNGAIRVHSFNVVLPTSCTELCTELLLLKFVELSKVVILTTILSYCHSENRVSFFPMKCKFTITYIFVLHNH
jgi:hypothetical protein